MFALRVGLVVRIPAILFRSLYALVSSEMTLPSLLVISLLTAIQAEAVVRRDLKIFNTKLAPDGFERS